jgi:hypothetical protein
MEDETIEMVQTLVRNRPDGLWHLATVVIVMDVLIPLLLRFKKNRRFDTRPLEIVFHGFMFGVFGLGLSLFVVVFGGFTAPFDCKPSIHFDLFQNVLPFAILLVFLLINLNTIGILFCALSRKLTFRTRAEHLLLISAMYYLAPLQLDERMAGYIYLELAILNLYSAKKVMESTSTEIFESLQSQIRRLDQVYSILRLGQSIVLISHASYQLYFPCSMDPDACYVQIFHGCLYFILWVFTGRQCLQSCKSHKSPRSKLE